MSARSTVFRAMFQHEMIEKKSNEILISDIDFCTVKDMVKFIYSGRLKDLADKSDLLLAAADKYDIKDLKNICCQHLAANLCVDQVLKIYFPEIIIPVSFPFRLWTYLYWLIYTKPPS